ncbi:MAG: 5-aminopentanamidase, partial [uncultured Solirubrobacteraceae bacterium]
CASRSCRPRAGRATSRGTSRRSAAPPAAPRWPGRGCSSRRRRSPRATTSGPAGSPSSPSRSTGPAPGSSPGSPATTGWPSSPACPSATAGACTTRACWWTRAARPWPPTARPTCSGTSTWTRSGREATWSSPRWRACGSACSCAGTSSSPSPCASSRRPGRTWSRCRRRSWRAPSTSPTSSSPAGRRRTGCTSPTSTGWAASATSATSGGPAWRRRTGPAWRPAPGSAACCSRTWTRAGSARRPRGSRRARRRVRGSSPRPRA